LFSPAPGDPLDVKLERIEKANLRPVLPDAQGHR